MSVSGFHAALKTQLLADADLTAWARGNFGRVLQAIDGNREIDTLGTNESPALIFEMGEGESAPEVGGQSQHIDLQAQVAIAWHENDAAKAYAQRVALPDLLIRAVLRDASLGEAVDAAWVSAFAPVRGGRPFVHVVRCTVSAEFYLNR